MRGIFDFLAKHGAYADGEKVWYVGLEQADCFWIDLVIDPPFGREALPPSFDFNAYLAVEHRGA